MPDGAPVAVTSGGWADLAFAHPLRRYQRAALDAFERVRGDGGTRAYLVLPPGAGKTVTGLEAARRLGQRTLVLTPNVAVQQQWLAEWERFWPVRTTRCPAAPTAA